MTIYSAAQAVIASHVIKERDKGYDNAMKLHVHEVELQYGTNKNYPFVYRHQLNSLELAACQQWHVKATDRLDGLSDFLGSL